MSRRIGTISRSAMRKQREHAGPKTNVDKPRAGEPAALASGGGAGGGDAEGAEDEVGKGGNEAGGVAESGSHLELLNAEAGDFFAGFDIDFVESFNVFGDEGDGDNEDVARAGAGELVERAGEGRLEPFLAADFALITKRVGIGGETPGGGALQDESRGGFDLALIGVALLDEAYGEAVGAEDDMDVGGPVEMGEAQGNAVTDGVDVARMIVEILDDVERQRRASRLITAGPFSEAGAGGGDRVLGIERKKD